MVFLSFYLYGDGCSLVMLHPIFCKHCSSRLEQKSNIRRHGDLVSFPCCFVLLDVKNLDHVYTFQLLPRHEH